MLLHNKFNQTDLTSICLPCVKPTVISDAVKGNITMEINFIEYFCTQVGKLIFYFSLRLKQSLIYKHIETPYIAGSQ